MFSFFKRNKSKPNPNNNNSSENANKTSVNMQLAIERQQASLAQNLEQKRANDVNDREQKDVNSHTSKDNEVPIINRSTALPSLVSEINVAACAVPKTQHYDQYRDARRSSSVLYDFIESAPRQGNTPLNYTPPIEKLSPTVVVASSSIKDQQKCSTIAGTASTNAYNSVYQVMGRGRNRNKHRGGGSGSGQNFHHQANQNKSVVKPQENSNELLENSIAEKEHKSEQNPNYSASAEENSEKSASISSENVFHDENSCSINSQQENKNDNIAASDEAMLATAAATNIVSDAKENVVKNDEQSEEQQVGAPLQRVLSSRRVTFAPSPPRSVASSATSDDEEETTTSEDIFYEATEAPSDTQKLRILSTVTSHSTDCMRIDEETSEVDGMSTFTGESSSSSTTNDVVCGKIILSVDEKAEASDNIKTNAFSSDETSTSISSKAESAPKTVKPSYVMVGEDTIALPDIVAESSSLLEQQQHLPADEM
jgi:hypothetical protein